MSGTTWEQWFIGSAGYLLDGCITDGVIYYDIQSFFFHMHTKYTVKGNF